MARRRRPTSNSYPVADYLLEYETSAEDDGERTCRQRWCRYVIITLIVLLILALLAFLGLFVIFPLVFKNSVGLQTSLVFATYNQKDTVGFTNFRKHGIDGVRNFYVNANEDGTIQLGVWHVLPLEYVFRSVENQYYSYDDALRQSTYPALLYFHGTGGNRITNHKMYRVLRRYFHVIAFDYRSYGDSTEGELKEEIVVQDGVRMYKWLQSKTNADIYVWGYSLGTAISTHTVARLRKEGIVPMGLFLESPFTSLREELEYSPLTKIFAWMPWFEATVLNPLEESGFRFKTIENILSVDCPILIVHAEDDPIVPFILGEKLSRVARDMRDDEIQGNVTFYSFPASFKFGHMRIYEAAEIPNYVEAHIKICEEYNKGRN